MPAFHERSPRAVNEHFSVQRVQPQERPRPNLALVREAANGAQLATERLRHVYDGDSDHAGEEEAVEYLDPDDVEFDDEPESAPAGLHERRVSGEYEAAPSPGKEGDRGREEVHAWLDADRRADLAGRAYRDALGESDVLSARYLELALESQRLAREVESVVRRREAGARNGYAYPEHMASIVGSDAELDGLLRDLRDQERTNAALLRQVVDRISENSADLHRSGSDKERHEAAVEAGKREYEAARQREADIREERELIGQLETLARRTIDVMGKMDAADKASGEAAEALLRASAEAQRVRQEKPALEPQAPSKWGRIAAFFRGPDVRSLAERDMPAQEYAEAIAGADERVKAAFALSAERNRAVDVLFQEKDALDALYARISSQIDEIRARHGGDDEHG